MGASRKSEGIPEHYLTKREFLTFCGTSFCVLCATHLFGFPQTLQAQMAQKGLIRTKLSPYFISLGGGEIQCELCPKRCRVPRGKRGVCRVRENRGGEFYSLVYANPCAFHLDPIERNPFSTSFVAPGLFRWQRRDAISGVSFARRGRSPRPLRRTYIATRFHRRLW